VSSPLSPQSRLDGGEPRARLIGERAVVLQEIFDEASLARCWAGAVMAVSVGGRGNDIMVAADSERDGYLETVQVGAGDHCSPAPDGFLFSGSSFSKIVRRTVGSRRGLSNLKLAWPIKSSGTEKPDPRPAESPLQAIEVSDFFIEFRRIPSLRILDVAKAEKVRPS
jgi:hypothetical protein